jgi:hypothetical protein
LERREEIEETDTIIKFNNNNTMERKPSNSQFGKAYALLIGNGNYSQREGFDDLEAPERDVDAVANFLGKTSTIKFDHIEKCVD